MDCGINDSYAVETDSLLDLITAWNPSDPALSFHEGNYFSFQQNFYANGTCSTIPGSTGESSNLLYYFHGAFMWITWALISFLQISTNRYWRDKWRWNKIAHAVLGFLAFALTVTAAFLAINHG